jgi:hypothetical protein
VGFVYGDGLHILDTGIEEFSWVSVASDQFLLEKCISWLYTTALGSISRIHNDICTFASYPRIRLEPYGSSSVQSSLPPQYKALCPFARLLWRMLSYRMGAEYRDLGSAARERLRDQSS